MSHAPDHDPPMADATAAQTAQRGTAASAPRRVAVIGGGITGLAAAHRLHELDPALHVSLFEASNRLGGVLETRREDGYLFELGADNFITTVPWAVDLCRRIGLADELLETDETRRRALVVRGGRLYPVPEGFMLMAPSKMWPILASPILSLRGRVRLLCEYFIPPRKESGDESLASFATRRLGREAFQRLVQPLVGGIYTADADKLSLAASLPRFLQMERQYGSLIRAVLKSRRNRAAGLGAGSGARYSLFVAPRDGMQSLVDALARRLPRGAVQLGAAVEKLVPGGQRGWTLQLTGARPAEHCDAVIVALPAPRGADVLESVDADAADQLRQIPYAGAAIAVTGYRRQQIADPLDGFGFVVPEIEHRRILSVSYSSNKYSGRAPEGCVLLRTFFGGAARPDLIGLTDDEIRDMVSQELGQLLGACGQPEFFRVVRWYGHMPQYHVGHAERIERIAARVARLGGLELAGNAYHGVGVPQCIHSGEQAAERVAAWLAGRQ